MSPRSKPVQRRRVVPPHTSAQAETHVGITDPLATFLLAHGELVPSRACCFAPWRSVRVPCEHNQALENKKGSSDTDGLRIVGRGPAAAGFWSPWSKQVKLIETTKKRETHFGLYLEGGTDRGLRRNGVDIEGLGS